MMERLMVSSLLPHQHLSDFNTPKFHLDELGRHLRREQRHAAAEGQPEPFQEHVPALEHELTRVRHELHHQEE